MVHHKRRLNTVYASARTLTAYFCLITAYLYPGKQESKQIQLIERKLNTSIPTLHLTHRMLIQQIQIMHMQNRCGMKDMRDVNEPVNIYLSLVTSYDYEEIK